MEYRKAIWMFDPISMEKCQYLHFLIALNEDDVSERRKAHGSRRREML
jgi:hypothetical protein